MNNLKDGDGMKDVLNRSGRKFCREIHGGLHSRALVSLILRTDRVKIISNNREVRWCAYSSSSLNNMSDKREWYAWLTIFRGNAIINRWTHLRKFKMNILYDVLKECIQGEEWLTISEKDLWCSTSYTQSTWRFQKNMISSKNRYIFEED